MRLVLPILLALPLVVHAADVHVRVSPDVKTGIESTTEYPTIQMAMDHHPEAGSGRVFLHIAPGVYHERVIVTQNHPRVTFLGMGNSPEDVVITAGMNARMAGGTFFTETVEVNGEAFEADNLTFENTAGNTGQAVAIAVRSDRAIFKHCRFLGHQDTLFADYGRQYYVDSYIEGTVDFIFGNAAAVFDRTEIHELAPGYLTAQSRVAPGQPTGYVILDSKVTADEAALAGRKFYLGRPWRPYSRAIFLNTELPATLDPAGWSKWSGTENDKTAFYAESGNTGPGANSSQRAPQRAPWTRQLTPAQTKPYLPSSFLRGADRWNPEAEAKKLP
ncbi:MAG: Pectinesterase [Edaphobacter sp.]|nr:Pectinesterase [Edaphobacter sp.]